ncbi:hypothetical protein EG328_003228 [Venturia inaequalis]|uniref:Cryptochrome DASH n=1 Tax=Venturia inaequalis TaxID=5025 RepID=A0A8H3UTE0_VENIN|nr:hypothetical protein EG328_003228 [Venturia inaequalis]
MAASPRILIYLLRRDLRFQDNPIFHEISKAHKKHPHSFTHLLPIYVFNSQQVEVGGFIPAAEESAATPKSPYPEARSQVAGFWRCGPHRAKFLAESVWDLKETLRKNNSDLLLRTGRLADVLRDAYDHFSVSDEKEEASSKPQAKIVGVWMTSDEGSEEKIDESLVREVTEEHGSEFRLFNDEKYYIDDRDLPFKSIQHLSDIFTSFRKTLEPLREQPRTPLPAPATLPPLPEASIIPPQSSPFVIPDTYDEVVANILRPLDLSRDLSKPPVWPTARSANEPVITSAHPFQGGETHGLKRLDHLFTSGAMSGYKDTRNGLIGADFSTKLSAYLAIGCITSRQIHADMVFFEDGESATSNPAKTILTPAERKDRLNRWKHADGFGAGENAGTAGVRFELLWRDYFRLVQRRYGTKLYFLSGLRGTRDKSWKELGGPKDDAADPLSPSNILDRFQCGTTGVGLIDASQRELYLTGYASNRVRQNVASFLSKHMNVDWRLGAEWYECMLVDYDSASNWGNWQYVAGVGNDPRTGRVFNPVKQALDYDPRGEYIKGWVPELRDVDIVKRDPHFKDGSNNLTKAAAELFSIRNLTRDALSNLSLEESLSVDPRPTFAVRLDLTAPATTTAGRDQLRIAYSNPALVERTTLLDDISGKSAENNKIISSYAAFRRWVLDSNHKNSSPFMFKEFLWTAYTLHHKTHSYKIIGGTTINSLWSDQCNEKSEAPIADEDGDDCESESNGLERIHSLDPATLFKHEDAKGQSTNLDWTQPRPPSNLSDHVRYARGVDWKSTPLGPIEGWETGLKAAANLVMADTHAAVIFWRTEGTMIYNEKYSRIIEGLHPCMGQSCFTALKDYTDHILPLFNQMKKTGQSIYVEDQPLFVRRDGLIEETYFCLKFSPIIGEDGRVAGFYESIVESTDRILLDRRVNTFIDVGSCTATARSLDDFWPSAMEALSKNPKDVPFALIYTIEDSNHPSRISSTFSNTSLKANTTAVLSGSLGVPRDHEAAPPMINLADSDDGFAPFFRKAMNSQESTVLHLADGSLPPHLVASINSPSFGDPVKSVAITTISPTGSDQILGFFVLGLNPRHPFDDGFTSFITATSRLLATACCSVVLLEEVREDLSTRLEAHQKRLESQEQRFEKIASRAHVGIFAAQPDGEYTYRNERWFDIFQIAKEEHLIQHAWPMLVEEEDLKQCEHAWMTLSQELTPVNFELRLRRTFDPGEEISPGANNPEEHKMWILISAYPEVAEDGSLKEVIGVVTDISRLKYAQHIQRRHTEDASAHAKALESFIDTTSHEMRNPLSAIIHCADALLETANQVYSTYERTEDIPTERRGLIETAFESAQTILQCANFQRRIVDDVLTMSKLENGLLVVTPVDVQPSIEVYHALKMFEAEAKEAKVQMGDLIVEQGYHDNAVSWVLFDPTRVIQIFINLITNAIKFTRFEQERHINISIDASTTEPAPTSHGVTYFQSSLKQHDPTGGQSWGDGDIVWIIITVEDTGRGLDLHEKSLLFNRFSQASPKTHIHYGGNGLGLFISRRLAELQGGAIGFESVPGKGSTFSFYVKARRSTNRSPTSHVGNGLDPQYPLKLPKTPLRRATTQAIFPSHTESQESEEDKPDVIHILVVEDNLVNQRVLAKQLRKLGAIVDVANHGVEALSHLELTKHWTAPKTSERELNVILMDWEMPVMDGVTCARRIRELQGDGSIRAHIPIIGTTANARATQIDEALAAGMDDVVSKPFRVPELMARIDTLLRRLESSRRP